MNVLVLGSGGREHAIVWSLYQSERVTKIFALPGNGGIGELAEILPGSELDFKNIDKIVAEKAIDMIVVGPETPLVAGIVDYFEDQEVLVFGPNRNAAQLEGSKAFSKRFMNAHGIPTAKYAEFSDVQRARDYLASSSFPVVIKADGLAAGKGVVIAQSFEEGIRAIESMMTDKMFGVAGATVVIEEFLQGEEASLLVFSDRDTLAPMQPAQDHKAIFDGDQGPNTGGMGAYCPAPVVTPEVMSLIRERVLDRISQGFSKDGIVFRGVLFVGLMMVKGDPYVLEFNVRFGDPETQVVLPRLKTDLFTVMEAVCQDRLDSLTLEWVQEPAVCVVMASQGYPGPYETGKEITGFDRVQELVFHAGTKRQDGRLISSGGRVLAVTSLAPTLPMAIRRAYDAVEQIFFSNRYYRKDIGQKALKR